MRQSTGVIELSGRANQLSAESSNCVLPNGSKYPTTLARKCAYRRPGGRLVVVFRTRFHSEVLLAETRMKKEKKKVNKHSNPTIKRLNRKPDRAAAKTL